MGSTRRKQECALVRARVEEQENEEFRRLAQGKPYLTTATGDVRVARFAELVRREALVAAGHKGYDRPKIVHGPSITADQRHGGRVFRPDPTAYVRMMERRGQALMLVLEGYGRIRKDGPICWDENIYHFETRPYDHQLDRGLWSVLKGEFYDELADYLFSIGRYQDWANQAKLRPGLKHRHSWYLHHGGKEPTAEETRIKALNLPGTKWFEVNSDDMAPKILPGDTVAINTWVTSLMNGETFLFEYEGKQIIRRLAGSVGEIRLTAANPKYPDLVFEIPFGPTMPFSVLGQMIGNYRDEPGLENISPEACHG